MLHALAVLQRQRGTSAGLIAAAQRVRILQDEAHVREQR